MPDERARAVLQRFDALAGARSNFESHWQEVSDHVIGRRDFVANKTPGTRRLDRIYDTTALHASGLLVVGLHSLLSNPATRWFSLTTEIPEIARVWRVRMWLDMVEERLYRVLSKPRRNFNGQMLEWYYDLVNFGIGVMAVENLPGEGPMFSAHPLAQFFLAEDRFGRIDTVYRKFDWSAREAKARFGDRAGQAVDRAIDAKKPETQIPFLHATQPSSVDKRLRYTGTRKPWESIYVSVKDAMVVDEGGFDFMPYAISRWQKDAGSPYANGCPSMDALPEARMLNMMNYTILRAGQKATDPPIMMPNEGVTKPFRSQAGGVTYYDPLFANSGNPVFPFPVDARGVGIGREMLNDKQQKVQEHYLFEILSMIRDPRMTATQVVEISNNVTRIVAPRLGGIQEQGLEPIIASAYTIETQAGRMPPPPPELSGQNLKVIYVSPVARAQRAGDVQSILQTLQDAQQYAQSDPDILHNINPDESIRRISEFRGVPASCLVDMQAVIQRRAAEAKLAQQKTAIDQASQVAQAAGRATPALQALAGGNQAA